MKLPNLLKRTQASACLKISTYTLAALLASFTTANNLVQHPAYTLKLCPTLLRLIRTTGGWLLQGLLTLALTGNSGAIKMDCHHESFSLADFGRSLLALLSHHYFTSQQL